MTLHARFDDELGILGIGVEPMGPAGLATDSFGEVVVRVDRADPYGVLGVECFSDDGTVPRELEVAVEALFGTEAARAVAQVRPGFGEDASIDASRAGVRRALCDLLSLRAAQDDSPPAIRPSPWWFAETALLVARLPDALGARWQAVEAASVAAEGLVGLDLGAIPNFLRQRVGAVLTAVGSLLSDDGQHELSMPMIEAARSLERAPRLELDSADLDERFRQIAETMADIAPSEVEEAVLVRASPAGSVASSGAARAGWRKPMDLGVLASTAERFGLWGRASDHWQECAQGWHEVGDVDRATLALGYGAECSEREGDAGQATLLRERAQRLSGSPWVRARLEAARELPEAFLAERLHPGDGVSA